MIEKFREIGTAVHCLISRENCINISNLNIAHNFAKGMNKPKNHYNMYKEFYFTITLTKIEQLHDC